MLVNAPSMFPSHNPLATITVKGVIQHGKEEYRSFMPGAVHASKGSIIIMLAFRVKHGLSTARYVRTQ